MNVERGNVWNQFWCVYMPYNKGPQSGSGPPFYQSPRSGGTGGPSLRPVQAHVRRWWMGARESFTRGAVIDSPLEQHSLRRQPRDPRRRDGRPQTTRDNRKQFKEHESRSAVFLHTSLCTSMRDWYSEDQVVTMASTPSSACTDRNLPCTCFSSYERNEKNQKGVIWRSIQIRQHPQNRKLPFSENRTQNLRTGPDHFAASKSMIFN